MENIVLIGMPGAGKSTVGVLLAKTLMRAFVDTDLLIQTRENRFLHEIIAHDGIEAFLDIEARTICELTVQEHVIATGGSVVYRQEAMERLRAHGVTVFLSLTYQTIARRLTNIATRGIAMPSEQSLAALYTERQPLYTQYADLTLDADGLTVEETVTRLTELLSRDERLRHLQR